MKRSIIHQRGATVNLTRPVTTSVLLAMGAEVPELASRFQIFIRIVLDMESFKIATKCLMVAPVQHVGQGSISLA
jgi:hypothetical protein